MDSCGRVAAPAPPLGAAPARGLHRLGLGATLVVIAAMHLPVMLLPGLGRDEAAYVVWAFHPEPAYAPLLQGLIRLAAPVAGFPAWQPRLAALALSTLVAALAAWRTQAAGGATLARWWAALALASSPWQAWVGPLLHPDNALLAACLLLAMAARGGHPWRIAACAALALAAKPTGVLLVPAACVALRACDPRVRPRAHAALGAVAVVTLAWASLLRPPMLGALAHFARLAEHSPALTRAAAVLLPVLVGAGPLLLAGAAVGARRRWRLVRTPDANRSPATREARTVLAAAAAFILFFAVAAVVNRQVKGSWLLPALALLWPVEGVSTPPRAGAPRRWMWWAFAAALAMSALVSAAFVRPQWLQRVEARGLPRSLAYPELAGERERRVSSARSWTDRMREYRSAAPFAEQVLREWAACSDGRNGALDRAGGEPPRAAAGRALRPGWIVSDDYGLAAQVVCAWNDMDIRIVLPGDGVFGRGLPPPGATVRIPPTLVLAVREGADALWPPLGVVVHCGAVRHPVTGEPVTVGNAGAARGPDLD